MILKFLKILTKMKKFIFGIVSILTFTLYSNAQELIIGEERVEPGLLFIFEGAIKDHVSPSSLHLEEKQTNVHIEARVNWDIINIPKGAPSGGFIPYLDIQVEIINQKTKEEGVYELIPHLNMSDNFHYANNLKLPGNKNDTYTVTFIISPPKKGGIGFHFDWRKEVNDNLISKEIFLYKDQNFSKIASQKRR